MAIAPVGRAVAVGRCSDGRKERAATVAPAAMAPAAVAVVATPELLVLGDQPAQPEGPGADARAEYAGAERVDAA